VREAWSNFRQSALFESNLARQVVRDVEQAHQNLAASELRLAELQTQVTAARQAFDQADASYNVGLATNLERVVAQDRLLNAELQLAGEEFGRKIAYLDLLRAVGGLREELEGRVARLPTTRATSQPANVPVMN
jgi:outer membrane protein TolC